jgi:hypothetical protein
MSTGGEPTSPLTTREVAQMLRASGEVIAAECRGLPERVVGWHPAPGEWCAKEVVGHLIETERRGFAGRVRGILAGEPIQSWDQVSVARERRDCARPLAALLDDFLGLRRDGADLVERLRPEDLARGGEHPKVGRLTVGDLLHEWVHHDRNHLKQIMSAVQDFAWPAMGNAQRFSLPG